MTKLIGIAGSLRSGSYNAALLRTTKTLMPSDAELEIVSIKGIPLYDGDIENNEGIPSIVASLKSKIADCDGLLLATPEYNHSIPGVMKNAIDWLSRPPEDVPKVFHHKPIAIIGATPGGFGTLLAQDAWLPVLRALGTKPWFGGRLLIAHAGSVFNNAGELTDEKIKSQLQKFTEGFVTFIRKA